MLVSHDVKSVFLRCSSLSAYIISVTHLEHVGSTNGIRLASWKSGGMFYDFSSKSLVIYSVLENKIVKDISWLY